jgi:hypothetical protein
MAKRRTMRKGKSKRKASAAFLNGANSWRTHLAAYRKAHPGDSLKLQMKGASKTYKKGSSGSTGSGSSGSGVTVKTSKYEVKVKRNRASKKKSPKKGTKKRKKRAGSKKRSRSKKSSLFW